MSATENTKWAETLTSNTTASGNLLCALAKHPTMPHWAKDKLMGAHVYVYAAMYFDFIVYADGQILGVDGVNMPDGSVKTTRQFLIDDIVENQLSRISIEAQDVYAERFADAIRLKIQAMVKTLEKTNA